MKANMASEGITTLFDAGQFMLRHTPQSAGGNIPGATMVPNALYWQMPWAFYGMTRDQYLTRVEGYQKQYALLTGKNLDVLGVFGSASGADQGMVASALRNNLTPDLFAQQITSDVNMQITYGWLRYGLNFQQFQQQKLGMQQAFGNTLNDAQAVQQLQYFHTNQGSDQAVRQQATLTQVEKQAAVQGAAQSEVR
jgi:hypothetical protein